MPSCCFTLRAVEVDGTEASPMKAVTEELDSLRTAFRETLAGYAARIENEISRVQSKVEAEMGRKKVSGAKLKDLRDMLTLLRRTQVKSEKGRRKDLKKIDAMVEDLLMLIESWK